MKANTSGIHGRILSLFTDNLSDPRQSVVLTGVISDWSAFNAGVVQGSILCHLLFIIYILMTSSTVWIHTYSTFLMIHLFIDQPILTAETVCLFVFVFGVSLGFFWVVFGVKIEPTY